MTLRRSLVALGGFVLALMITVFGQTAAIANISGLNLFLPEANLNQLILNNGQELIVDKCVYFDGHCLFTVAAPRSEIDARLDFIQRRLIKTKAVYNEESDPDVVVRQEVEEDFHNIIIEIDGKASRLMTVTRWDAELYQEDVSSRTTQIVEQIQFGLERGWEERTESYLRQQGAIAVGILVASLLIVFLAQRWEQRIRKHKKHEEEFPQDKTIISTQLNLRQVYNLQEVQIRLSQLLSFGAIAGAGCWILWLFPQTRIINVWLIEIFKYPIKFAIIIVVAYLAIRLSYALIAKFNQFITAGALEAFVLITQESNRRLQLRVDTFSRVMRSIVTIAIGAIALMFCLWSFNINIAPILAGAGIIGLAISFAAQNFLKDIINGFCIIFEDQYAVGDVINVSGVGGLVENMNLRITQIRDAEGRLITIPNSEVRIVANHSNHWSRADLNIPIAYRTDVDLALKILDKTAQTMGKDEYWSTVILEELVVLGVDNFHERGLIIKVWIKTLPLKQWEVAREYRRLVHKVFEAEGIQIPATQNDIWLHQEPKKKSDRPEQLSLFP